MSYLWPRTSVGNLQAEIWQRVGASDYHLADSRCRTRSIIEALGGMIENKLLPETFRLLDLCCGDGVILWHIQRRFGDSACLGLDLLEYPEHVQARRVGVVFMRLPIQKFINLDSPPDRFDVVMMLNTWRGWERAGLDPDEADLPRRVEGWMKAHARYIIVTAGKRKRREMMEHGWWLADIGKGEDQSRMVLAWPCDNGEGRWTFESAAQP